MKLLSFKTIIIFLCSYNLLGQTTNWDTSTLKEHWKKNGIDAIEGIYENTIAAGDRRAPKYTLGLIKSIDGYNLILLDNANLKRVNVQPIESTKSREAEGDIKAYLTPTANPLLYKTKWYRTRNIVSEDLYITFDTGIMKVVWTDNKPSELYIKIFPSAYDSMPSTDSSAKLGSGTGFAISSNGILVTNYHVIDGAKNIMVRGVNSNFSKTYTAKTLITDKRNDLALIQIDDKEFTSLETIPYTIKTSIASTGENIYALGYPLRATMGDEIKLTNGIISSRTGFQGDITTYQISAPVHPGNSGGPLFDEQGNLIGIINAKHSQAENVSYAIKTSYLTSLIELLNEPLKLTAKNLLTGKILKDKIELIKNFVYIIETN